MTSQALLQRSTGDHTQSTVIQSSALVQIFLNAAIACIAHTRELIPWTSPCFQTRYVDEIQLDFDCTYNYYREFCDSAAARHNESQEFRILQRGKDRRADVILNMMDGGMLHALEQGFLHAMQLLIVADPTDPASALETYVFLFNYQYGQVSQISVSSSTAIHFNLRDIHRGFSATIRTLLKSLRNLPRLPRHRSLGISLLYNDDCPADYHPVGFEDVKQYTVTSQRSCWAHLWQSLPAPVAEFDAGSLRVSVGAKSLQFVQSMSRSQLQDTELSAQLRNMQNTSSRDLDITPTATSPTQDIAPMPVVNIDTSNSGYIRGRDLAASGTNSNQNTDQNTVISALLTQEVRPPVKLTKISTATTNSLAKLTVASKNRRRRNVTVSKLAELLVQARAMENNSGVSRSLFDMAQMKEGRIRRLERSGPIACACGGNYENEHMLLCELCGTQQHKVCYGYDALRQGCCPEEHFCYECLLLPREVTISSNMSSIVHMRLALLFLTRQPSSYVRIGQDFLQSVFPGSDSVADLLQIIDRLVDEGYLSQREDEHASISQTADRVEAQTTYLEPLAGIVHHYQIVRDGDTTEKRKSETLTALRSYVKDRFFSFDDESNSGYDQIYVKNNVGRDLVRWGFYPGWKRKHPTESSDAALHLRKKISLSTTFIKMDRSTPSEVMSMNEAMLEAIEEAESSLRTESCFGSEGTDFN